MWRKAKQVKLQLYVGIFVQIRCPISPFNFLSILERTLFGGPREKTPRPTIYFPSSLSNQTHSKKVFIPIFFPKFFFHLTSPPNKYTLRVCLVGVKTGRIENRKRKIEWKMLLSTVWLRKENRRDRKQGRKFSLLGPLFLFSQIGRKIGREK